ncbi:MAG: hypothetical protein ACOYMB_02350 [Patescibacteria group bacterium]
MRKLLVVLVILTLSVTVNIQAQNSKKEIGVKLDSNFSLDQKIITNAVTMFRNLKTEAYKKLGCGSYFVSKAGYEINAIEISYVTTRDDNGNVVTRPMAQTLKSLGISTPNGEWINVPLGQQKISITNCRKIFTPEEAKELITKSFEIFSFLLK